MVRKRTSDDFNIFKCAKLIYSFLHHRRPHKKFYSFSHNFWSYLLLNLTRLLAGRKCAVKSGNSVIPSHRREGELQGVQAGHRQARHGQGPHNHRLLGGSSQQTRSYSAVHIVRNQSIRSSLLSMAYRYERNYVCV
jgi:hypothetical protein